MLSLVGRARGLLCLFLFMPFSSNRLQKPTVWLGPRTEPSLPQMGWTVQSAICDGNSHAAKEGNSCRVAAQSNPALQRTAAGRRGCNRRASWPPSLSWGR